MVEPEACSCVWSCYMFWSECLVCLGMARIYLVCMIAPPSSAKLAPHIKVAITDGHLLRLLCYLWSLEHFCLLLLLLLGHPPLSDTSINIFEAFIVVLKS